MIKNIGELRENEAIVENGQVKFGPKKRHVPTPNGWFIVQNTKCKSNDKFLNLAYGNWEKVDEDDIGLDCEEFCCLIRQAKTPEN